MERTLFAKSLELMTRMSSIEIPSIEAPLMILSQAVPKSEDKGEICFCGANSYPNAEKILTVDPDASRQCFGATLQVKDPENFRSQIEQDLKN